MAGGRAQRAALAPGSNLWPAGYGRTVIAPLSALAAHRPRRAASGGTVIDARLRIALIGPPAVYLDGVAVSGWSPKLNALVLVLVWSARPVERGQLCALLWPDVPEERARLSLRVALSRLRPVVGDRLRADRRTVALVVRPDDDVDLGAVRALAAGAAGAIVDGVAAGRSPAAPPGPLGEGLEDGLPAPFRDWLSTARVELDAELLRRALCAAAAAPATRPSAADELRLDVLRSAVARDPLHEHLVGELIAELARAGAYAEAERVYARFAARLRDQAGLSPAPATARLRERAAAAARRGVRHNLPPLDPAPVDRATLARLAGWIEAPERRLVTVVGPAGAGKTALAVAAARAVAGRFIEGALWLPPAGGDAGPLGARVAAARAVLDGKPAGDAAVDDERLLVLDGLAADDATAAAVVALLEAAPRHRVLATARRPLDLVFEHRFPVAGP